jgi:hypothetical protein
MKRLARAGAAVGLTAGLLFLAAPPVFAGSTLTVDVTGTARCVGSGQAEVTWVATVNAPTGSTTSLVVVDPTLNLNATKSPLGGSVTQAVVQFDGVQSGAATGAVSFVPFQVTVPASNSSFPVDSQAVVLDPGNTGGAVTLDVTVLVFDPDNTDQNITVVGSGAVDLPVCEQPAAPTSADTAAAATTRPRFTG